MNILNVSKVGKEFSGEALFNNISFDINSKDKVAIIGKNGTGKSTLLKMILDEIEFDYGNIYKNPNAKIGYLSQDVISTSSNSLFDEMINVFKEVRKIEDVIKEVADKLALKPNDKELLKQYSNLEHIFQIKGGYEYLYRINLILSKFGFKKDEYQREISSFSGGEKTRVAFAKLLLEEPELLILDEPTNHLDIDIIEWLEDYLNKYKGAVLMVTHDKYFISKVCRKIIELDQLTAHTYYGTFEQYQEEKIKRYEQMLKRYTRQQKEIAHLQSFVDRFKFNAKRASIAKDREKKIARIDKLDKPHLSKRKVKLSFENKRATKDIILEAKDLSIGYDIPLVSNMNFTMRGYDKLAIIGPNGTGKTTLLKVIEKKLKPLSGKLEFLREYKVGYFDQNQETLHNQKTIFAEIHDYHPHFTNNEVRSVAARFLFFSEDLDKPISVLSGGEKVRLVLCLLMLENPDLLILDEPTNHLDIETKNIVEDVFNEFTGPIIFVSHDRYFINKIGTKIVYLTSDTMQEFEGDYDAFKEVMDVNSIKKEKKARVKSVKEKKIDVKQLEKKIHKIEAILEQLDQDLYKSENYTDKRKMDKLNQEIENHKVDLEELYEVYYEEIEE